MYSVILFDMDNTLLQSNINFREMRSSLIEYLVQLELAERSLFEGRNTPAQVIEYAKQLQGSTAEIENALWDIVLKYEALGMSQLCLEEGVQTGLQYLQELDYKLAVVTNNAYSAATKALQETEIAPFFELIVGREQMSALKPSPSGINCALAYFECAPKQALMVGDSWIDGQAALRAKVDFIAYKMEQAILDEQNIASVLNANHFTECVEWIVTQSEH